MRVNESHAGRPTRRDLRQVKGDRPERRQRRHHAQLPDEREAIPPDAGVGRQGPLAKPLSATARSLGLIARMMRTSAGR
jgi:hypothetical protein